MPFDETVGTPFSRRLTEAVGFPGTGWCGPRRLANPALMPVSAESHKLRELLVRLGVALSLRCLSTDPLAFGSNVVVEEEVQDGVLLRRDVCADHRSLLT